MSKSLPRGVWLLGWTSLLNDAASEAIYPLLPMFVTTALGGHAVSLGIIEGTADAASSLLKVVAGRASDALGRRRPLVIAGYGVAAVVRPLIALATAWPHVFAIRVVDRVGKGIRGAPRDAMLAALAPAAARGRVFGFHRAMDHTGAIVGPIAAALFLWLRPDAYRTLFALTVVPGALAVALLFFVREAPRVPQKGVSERGEQPIDRDRSAAVAWRPLPSELKRFLLILALFTLGNSSDAFLLLQLSAAGLPVAGLPLVWAALHVVKAGLSTTGGSLSDRYGRRALIVVGWLVYAGVYAGFAFSTSIAALSTWLLVYGVHFALVEGSEKALVADLTPDTMHGTAFGWYNAVLGLGALAASLLFAAIWQAFGAPAAFLTGSGLAIAASTLLLVDGR
ncbi:MAG: MFS transporter [Acidobacteria bacterium]|nr:MFS transporter [Acidobacteriota bacterium]